MNRRLTSLLVGVAAAFASSVATANPYYVENVYVESVYDRTICTDNINTPTTISTLNLQPYYADTMLVVVGTGHGSYSNDDCGASSFSCVSAESTDGCFRVIVFATYWTLDGTCDVSVDFDIVDQDVSFGGTLVPLSGIQPNIYSIHTAHGPGSGDATRTDLYLFDDQWNLRLHDDQGGAGQQATLYEEFVDSGDMVLVAADSPSTDGYTDLLVNDCVDDPDRAPTADSCQDRGYDYDNDFLADSLEADIGTYQADHDTDDDGLFDYYELIGRFEGGQVVYTSQGLSAIGADPFRRDLFLEFDTRNIYADLDGDGEVDDDTGDDVQPPDQDEMQELQNVFNDLPKLENPDGGIAVHADVGSPNCPLNPSLCGDWGGTDVGLTYDGRYAKSYTQIKQNNFFYKMRWGLFHYVYLTDYGTGQTSGRPGSSLYSNGTDNTSSGIENTAGFVAHELGHNLGLSHYGATDAVPFNQKSAYPSLMNYNWAYSLPNTLSERGRFSEGTMHPIDHLNLYEQSYTPGVSKAYLRPDSLGNGRFRYRYDTSTDQMDFNYDGRYGVPGEPPLYGVRYDISPLNAPTFGAARPEYHHQREIPGPWGSSGGDVVVIPAGTGFGETAEVWAFTVGWTIGGPLMTYSVMSNTLGTPSAWPAWDIDDLPTAGCNFAGRGEISAALFDMQGLGEQIVLFYGDDDGICYLTFDPDASPSTWPSSWSQMPGFPAGVSGVENVSVAVIASELAVMFMDPAVTDPFQANVYVATMDYTGAWSTQPTLISNIHTYLTPGFTIAPDAYVYMVAVDPGNFDLEYYRRYAAGFGSGTGWTLLFPSESDLAGYAYGRGTQHLSLEFVPFLKEYGTPFDDGTGYLAAFWNVDKSGGAGVAEKWFAHRAYTTGYIGPISSDLKAPEGWRRMAEWQRPKPDLSLGIDKRAGGVAMLVKGTDNWKTTGATSFDSIYVPYATGLSVLPDENEDHDDAATIDANMCYSVWLLAKGGAAGCYCATANDPDVSCGPPPPVYDSEEPCPPAG